MAQDNSRGREIYEQQCASCHGANGEGVPDAYADALIGDRSIKELTQYIHDRMPEGEPEKCVGPDAEAVARYIHEAFYSEIAQARNRPAQIQFSRLTVRQYENAVADLLASFTERREEQRGERGLDADYYDNRRDRRDDLKIERVDPVVDFNFAAGSPDADNIKAEEFAINWNGSVFAPDTGDYEFIVECDNGVRLWVNDMEQELVDAWVKSGSDREFRGTVRLLGGRWYGLKLEFFKYKEPTAAIRLRWKPPHRADQLVPVHCLSTTRPEELFVLTTPFPPDDRSTGYEVGTAVSPEWEEATTFAALEVAAHVVNNLGRYAGYGRDDAERPQKIRRFCEDFLARAFRKPLDEEERAFFVDRQFAEGIAPEEAAKRVVLLALKSPRFLYREYGFGPLDDHDVAAWLSFTCWDSLPDRQLREAASNGQLQTEEQIRQQVERMQSDPRTKAKLREFLHQWLSLGHLHEVVKNAEQHPDFNPAVFSDMWTSLDLFLDDVAWSETSDYRQLLLSGDVYLNGGLARFFGADLADNAPFTKVDRGHEGRAGVLTHPLLMSGFAYDAATSPIHRGVFISRGILGRRLKSPPVAVAPLAPDLEPHLNTRERVILQTSPGLCQTCHTMINPLGFALERFDAVGRFRDIEKDRPIDDRGEYIDRQGNRNEFVGSRGLAEYLASSPESHAAFVERQFQFFTKQPIRAFGDDQLPKLQQAFETNGFHIRRLLADSIVDATMRLRSLVNDRTSQTLSSQEHQP